MRDYKHVRYHTRFPRTQREAGWHAQGEWQDKEDGSGWVAAIGWGAVGALVLWLFLVVVLG